MSDFLTTFLGVLAAFIAMNLFLEPIDDLRHWAEVKYKAWRKR